MYKLSKNEEIDDQVFCAMIRGDDFHGVSF